MNTRCPAEAMDLFLAWARDQGKTFQDIHCSSRAEVCSCGNFFRIVADGVAYLVFIAYKVVRLATTVSL